MSPKAERDLFIAMLDTTTPLPLTRSRAEQIFPVLTPPQIGRIAAIGRARPQTEKFSSSRVTVPSRSLLWFPAN
jgi:hypothetical protein